MTREIGFQRRDVERQNKLKGRVGVGEWRLDNHVDQVEHVEERGLGFVEEVGFGFGVGGGEFVIVAKEGEKVHNEILYPFKHFSVPF